MKIWNIFSLLLIMSAFIPYSRSDYWWIRVFDFPRLQSFILTAICFVFYFKLKDKGLFEGVLLFGLIAAICVDLYRIFPYTRLARKESIELEEKVGTSFKVLSTNVLQDNRNSKALLDLVQSAKPEMVLVLEGDTRWENDLREIEKDYPFTIKKALDNTYGMLLYSKLELINPEIKFLVEESVPSFFVEVKPPNTPSFTFIGIHPRPPTPAEGPSDQRDSELMHVARYVRERQELPILLAGDLNDVAWSHTTRLFKRVSQMLDPRVGRGFYNTFPVNFAPIRFPLDHFFHTPSLRLVELKRMNSIDSDHFPIMAEFAFAPVKNPPKEEKASRDDLKEAEELKNKL